MEITIISAQGLKKMSGLSLFSAHRRLRPFVTVSTYPKTTTSLNKKCYITRIDDNGGINPTWGDKFVIPVDASFFGNTYSCIYLQLYTKRLLSGREQLGWCQIPVADLGLSSEQGSLRYLSYRVRDHRDGTRGQGILNVAVRTLSTGREEEGRIVAQRPPPVAGRRKPGGEKDSGTVIGIPVDMISNMRICQ
ncbi:BON1-associated protein 2 [Linum grandiflorum]